MDRHRTGDSDPSPRLRSLLELLHHVCLSPPQDSSDSGSEKGGLGQRRGHDSNRHNPSTSTGTTTSGLTAFRSAILRVITHLSSGVAGFRVAISIARASAGLEEPLLANTCLKSLATFLSYQTQLVRELRQDHGRYQHQRHEEISLFLDFFSYGLCLESLKNLMSMAAIPFTELMPLIADVVTTLEYCEDMRVLCAAACMLSTVLAVLSGTSSVPTKVDTGNEHSNTECGDDGINDSDDLRPLYTFTSDERLHVVHYICTNVVNDEKIMTSLTHIFRFFLFNKSSSFSSSFSPSHGTLNSSSASMEEEESFTPSASTCDPSMWLLGNEFGLRTTGRLPGFLHSHSSSIP